MQTNASLGDLFFIKYESLFLNKVVYLPHEYVFINL